MPKMLFADPEYRPMMVSGPPPAPSPDEEFERLIEQFETAWHMLAAQPHSEIFSANLSDRAFDIRHHPLCSASTRVWLVMAFADDAIAFD